MTTNMLIKRRFEKNNESMNVREILPVILAGAGRATTATLPRHAKYNETSKRFAFAFEVNDPAPGKAFDLASMAAPMGLAVRPQERTIQEAIRENPRGTEPVLLHIDDAAAMHEAVGLVRGTPHPLAGAFVMKSPTDRLLAVFFVLQPGDEMGFDRLTSLLSTIARFQAPGGGSEVLGEGARSEHRVVEQSLRKWMADGVQTNLPRMAAGLPLETPAITLTEDGVNSTPLFVHAGENFSAPHELAEVIAERGEWRVRLGAPVSIAEVTGDGLRVHRIRRRVLDRRLTVESTATVLSEAERQRETLARKQAAEALSLALTRAERETVNDQAPVLVTD